VLMIAVGVIYRKTCHNIWITGRKRDLCIVNRTVLKLCEGKGWLVL